MHADKPFFLIAGPCVVESAKVLHEIAQTLKTLCTALDIPLIFKASYKKDNRTKWSSFTGIGAQEGLSLIRDIGHSYRVRTLTDIHTEAEAALAASYVDILQIPAFLSRQTSLLVAAAQTGKTINIKKGQFSSAAAMRFAIDKVTQTNKVPVWLTERGNSFGYTDLIVDFRNVPIMQDFQVPVIVDCTHAVQQPNQNEGVTGGTPRYIGTLAQAAIAAGADGIFLETHPRPEEAKSDGANMLPLSSMERLLRRLVKLRSALRNT